MSGKPKQTLVSCVSYLFVFLGFALSYMFTYPQYDVLIFTRDYESGFLTILNEAVHYGNGRLLGNVLGFYFSHHFTAAIFVTAFFLTLTVYLANRLFFDGKSKYIFPVAVMIALPAIGIMREVYCMTAAFCNYAVPFVFALISCNLIKNLRCGGSRLLLIPLALSSACACLFSENTTVVLICLAVLIVVFDFIKDKKFSVSGAVNLVFTTVGTAIMIMIPRVTDTTEKLSYYRGYVTEPMSLLYNALSALRSFAVLAAQYLPIYLVISAVMIFVLFRHCKLGKSFKIILTALLCALPLLSLLTLIFFEKASGFSAVYLLVEIVYLSAVIAVSVLSKRKEFIISTLATVILLGSAVAPMMIVNHRGDRTFFTTFAILLCFALYLISVSSEEMHVKAQLKRTFRIASPIVFAAVSLTMLVLCAQNFAAYSFRADFIANQATTTLNISVPELPHSRLATEKTFNQIDPCLLFEGAVPSYSVISSEEWEKGAEYKKITDSSPVEAVVNGIKYWKFKDPEYPEKLFKAYSMGKNG